MKQRLLSIIFIFAFIFFLQLPAAVQAARMDISDPGKSNPLQIVAPPNNISIQSVKYLEDGTVKVTIGWEASTTYVRLYTKNEGDNDFQPAGYLKDNPFEITFPVMRSYFSLVLTAVKQTSGAVFESTYSNTLQVQWDRPTLAVPTGLSIRKTQQSDDTTTAHLVWNTVTGAEKYTIYHVKSNGAREKIGETEFSETTLTYGTYGQPFLIAVAASHQYEESPLSTSLSISRTVPLVTKQQIPTVTATVVNTVPSPPQNLQVAGTTVREGIKEIELQWDRSEGAEIYYIFIATTGSFEKLISVTSNRAVLKVPADFISFDVVVTAGNFKGESTQSNRVEVAGKKTEIELIVPTNNPSTIPIATPRHEPQKSSDVLGAISVEEQSVPDEEIVLSTMQANVVYPTPTSPDGDENTQQRLSIVDLIKAFIMEILKSF